jgi:predicted short-subunit dehydrogenase-like oxidoreductase (DUF2520 family)
MPNRYLVEGDRAALRAARYLVAQLRGAAMLIESERYPLFCAAVTFSSSLFTPIIEGCMSAMRGAGVSGTARAQIIEALCQQSLRTYMYSGRRSWSGTVADGDERGMKREMEALAALQPELANLYRVTAQAAIELFKRPAMKNAKRTPTKATRVLETV